MAKAYYLCDVIGTGTDGDGYRPAAADHGVSFAGSIPTGPDGRPTASWVLVIVDAIDHRALKKDPRIQALPSYPLSAKLAALANADRTGMIAALTARGIPASIVDTTESYRDIVNKIGRRLEAGFDADNFDVN